MREPPDMQNGEGPAPRNASHSNFSTTEEPRSGQPIGVEIQMSGPPNLRSKKTRIIRIHQLGLTHSRRIFRRSFCGFFGDTAIEERAEATAK